MKILRSTEIRISEMESDGKEPKKMQLIIIGSDKSIEDPNCISDLIEFASHYNTALKERFEQNFQEVQNLAEEMNIDKGFLNKRKRRGKIIEIDETQDEGSNLTLEELFKIQIYGVLDTLLSQIDWRYQKMETICDDFCFLYGSSLQYMSVDDLKKSAADLPIKYSKDLKNYKFTCKIESLK
ncbi:hypothetical protein ILUMI_01631 [Ignelater luminosus]|uniref:Uncharacterized protein n=1 Tax=Ignelater luminosus TaxID=2038154 RepID=A0A8K0GK26_IGNLU|nr:hypothetical protein ILUMI_01631 [Ignelater luminosus]